MSNSSEWYQDDVALLGELRRSNIDDVRPPVIDGYDDFREIRRGGQGIVYTAMQRSTRRRVAIKLIREGGLASRTGRRRFEREVDLIASLRHPNIVRIYDSGFTQAGRPYFVMEYIEGLALDEYVRESLPRTAGGATLKDLLRLMGRVAEAVSHAHQRGVIHRDLKPSNIRVDAAGEPHVLDFGLAKLVGDGASDATRSMDVSITGQFMGSLPWASPEQAEGAMNRIDVRTDVYALGVILYQMLTGSFPYEVVGSLRDVLENIVTVEPTRPSSVHHRIDDEVETMIMKCLAKERERRYQSARALADDIARYLAGEPIEAKRDSTWYTLRKTARRYRVAVTFTSIALVLSLGFAIAMTVLYRRASAAESTAETRLSQVVVSKERADAERLRAEQTKQFLVDMLKSVDPIRAKGKDVTLLREILDDAARRIEHELIDHPAVRASLHHVLGASYRSIAEYAQADEHLVAALQIYSSHLGETARDTLIVRGDLGVVRMNQGRLDEAAPELQFVYDHLDLIGTETRDGIATISNLATLRSEQADYADARLLHERALELMRRQFGDEDYQTLVAMNNVASICHRLGDFDTSLSMSREVLAVRRRIFGDEHPDTIVSMNNFAAVLKQLSRFAEARPLYEESMENSRRVYGAEHPATLLTQANLAALLHTIGELEAAEALARSTVEAQRRVLGPDHGETLRTTNNLAYLLEDMNKTDEAEAMYREVLAGFERSFGPDHPETAFAVNNLAHLLQTRGNMAEAAPLFQRALDIRLATLGEAHPNTLFSMNNLASLLQAQGRWEESEALYRQTLEVRRRVLGSGNLDTAVTCNNLAKLLLDRDRPAEAEPFCREAVEIATNVLPARHWIIAAFQGNLGTCLSQLGRYDAAEPLLLDAHAAMVAAFGEDDARTRGVLKRIVELYEAWGRAEEAARFAALLPAEVSSGGP